MIIDAHTHTFPEQIAKRAIEKLTAKTGHAIAPVSDGTVAGLLNTMRAAQVDRAVLCPVATRPEQAEDILTEARAIRDGARGEDAARRLIPLASVHPADPKWAKRLQAVADADVRGVKLHPYYQEFVLDAPDTLAFLKRCRDLNLIVQCHCGYDIGFPRDPICGPERVAHVMREIPGLRFIAAHLGGWLDWEASARHLLGKDVYLDTAVLRHGVDDPHALRLLREHGPDKLLFATDAPWMSFDDGFAFIRAAGLPADTESAILGGNAQRLFSITEKGSIG
ncbi:MAG: amidohydrolase family protein [Kiritimatiellaeota bacterium]|nr:amidohydrolase family protein [Kiritimatiellota bacterium]